MSWRIKVKAPGAGLLPKNPFTRPVERVRALAIGGAKERDGVIAMYYARGYRLLPVTDRTGQDMTFERVA